MDDLVDDLWEGTDDGQITIDGGDSSDATKLVLVGGTLAVLAAAGALAASMGNDLGIDLELG